MKRETLYLEREDRETMTPSTWSSLKRIVPVLLAVGAVFGLGAVAVAATPPGSDLQFTDVEKQSRQFIEWERTLKLTPEQEAIKREALSAIPAPCCSDNSAYTCCCPCNMAKTIWGLSEHLIVDRGYNADQVRKKAREWIAFINPKGFSGDVCYTGGCGRSFAANGCGGMGSEVRF
jgi:hypothetical protein